MVKIEQAIPKYREGDRRRSVCNEYVRLLQQTGSFGPYFALRDMSQDEEGPRCNGGRKMRSVLGRGQTNFKLSLASLICPSSLPV